MSHAGWVDVWKLVLAIVAREPVAFQIFFGVGAAFAAVMFLEGIYASFLPVRYAKLIARKFPGDGLKPVRTASASGPVASRAYESQSAPFAPRPRNLSRNHKKQTSGISRHRPTKPGIHRVTMPNAAPSFFAAQPFEAEEMPTFSPLPPLPETAIEVSSLPQ
jgi:hypothetical protein